MVMKLNLEFVALDGRENVFIKLPITVVHQLHAEALSTFSYQQLPPQISFNDWYISKEALPDIHFLPLKVDTINDNGVIQEEFAKVSYLLS